MVPVTSERKELATRLESLGADVTQVECIAIAPPGDPATFETAVASWLAGEYDWMAVTSRNAVLAMDRVARAAGGELGQPQAAVAVVGEATERVCREAGLSIALVPQRADARGLVEAFPTGFGRVLAPLGNLASPVLARGLSRKGWHVDVVEAYRTVDGPGLSAEVVSELLAGHFDAMLLTSSSVATRIRKDLGEAAIPAGTAVVAIGETTAAGARAVSLPPTAVATVASHDGILEALVSVLEDLP